MVAECLLIDNKLWMGSIRPIEAEILIFHGVAYHLLDWLKNEKWEVSWVQSCLEKWGTNVFLLFLIIINPSWY